ncbi:GNAT family N-acetyltransferase [soil metagenome]
MIEVVRAEEGHLDAFFDIVSRTYNSGDPVPEHRKEERPFFSRYVALRDGRPVGSYVLYEHEVLIRGAALRCGGVAAVAVPPESRDGGMGAAMMRAAVRRMREDGFVVASLYAYREPFYAKAGYASVGRRFKIECPSHRLPKGGGMAVRRLTPEDWRELEPCYRAFSEARNGMSIRTEEQWGRVLAENRPLTVYAVGEPVEAYVVVSHKTDFWSTDHLSEIVWATPQGYAALLGVLRGLATNKKALSWFEPGDGPFAYRYMDEGVEISMVRPIMARIVDVKALLEACRVEGEFSFSVRDESVPENEGSWRVSSRHGRTVVEPAEQGEFSTDIGTLTQALYGEPSLSDSVRMGAVEGEPSADALRFFSAGSGYCLDFF